MSPYQDQLSLLCEDSRKIKWFQYSMMNIMPREKVSFFQHFTTSKPSSTFASYYKSKVYQKKYIGYKLRDFKTYVQTNHLYMNVHCSMIHNSQTVKTPPMSSLTNDSTRCGIFIQWSWLSYKKDINTETCHSMDQP